MSTLNPAEVVNALANPVAAVIVARAKAEVLREEVDAIQARILAESVYTNQYDGTRITLPQDSWMMKDEESPAYFALVSAAVAEAGMVVPEGFCPALMAENELVKREHELVEASRPFFGVTTDQLLLGTKTKGGLETRREFLDLLLRLCVNYREAA